MEKIIKKREGILIIKIQVPLATNTEPTCLIYNEDQSFRTQIPYCKQLKKLMKKEFKKYFYAIYDEDKTLRIGGEAKNQDW